MMGMTNAEDQALEEYKSLRGEILNNDRLCLQGTTIALSATGLILSYGLTSTTSNSYWILLIPIPILATVYYYITDKRFGTWVIASYVATFLEPQMSGLNWESRLRKFRDLCDGEKNLVPGQNPILNELILFNLLIIFSGILFGLKAIDDGVNYILIPVFIWAIFAVFSIRLYLKLIREGREGDRLAKLWDSIKRDEDST